MASAILRQPVRDASAWTAADFAGPDAWVRRFSPAMAAEIVEAAEAARARGLEAGRLTAADFPLPAAAAVLAAAYDDLENGRGFTVLRGFPLDRLDPDLAVLAFCGVAAHLGVITVQNAAGARVVDVVDKGIPYSATSRGYNSNKLLPFHTDGANFAGLLCLGVAKAGGESVIASSVSIYNAILAERPDLLEVYERGFYHHRRGEQPAGEVPLSPERIPVFHVHDGLLHCCYNRNPVEWATREGVRLSEREREALDVVDALAARPALQARMDLQRGDLQFVNNFVVLHSRSEFVDAPGYKRHLVRLWLNDPRSKRHGPTLLDLYAPAASLNRAAG